LPIVDFDEGVKGRKTDAMIAVLRAMLPQPPRDILVVGCGSGFEAGDLARSFGAATVGIDVGNEFAFDHAAAAPAVLRIMDAQKLDFADASFDLVYSFHALEHIPQPRRALAEMARVLRPGCSYLIGTPNKSRLIGYMGSPSSLKNKLLWNLQDFKMRITGRWSNEAGAHAGFAEKELRSLCAQAFGGKSHAVSDDYYRFLYASKKKAVDALVFTGLKSVLYPCVYVAGRKQSS
jgi:ubiquinone/menaquinone biosynthesis C-methylase UbiE